MAKYQKKAVPVEAFCYYGTFPLDFLTPGATICKYGPEDGRIKITSGAIQGAAEWIADPGDWIVRRASAIYVAKADEFERDYEPVPGAPANRAGCDRCGGTGTRRAGDALVHCECSHTTTNTGPAGGDSE